MLEVAAKSGADILPWHSKLTAKPSYEDKMYNDFRIAHFHLGEMLENNGYMERTKELLFAVVTTKSLYEIGIYNHGDWYELDLLEIIDTNWPELLDHVTLKGIENVITSPSNRDEVKAFRSANCNTIMKLVSGRLIAPPGGGVMTDGTSTEAMRTADIVGKLLLNGAERIKEDIMSQIGNQKIPKQDYEIVLNISPDIISATTRDGRLTYVLWKREQ